MYQLGLVEREIQEVLSGHLKVQSPKRSTRSNGAANKIERRSISMEDTCPICQESLMEERHQKRLTYCKCVKINIVWKMHISFIYTISMKPCKFLFSICTYCMYSILYYTLGMDVETMFTWSALKCGQITRKAKTNLSSIVRYAEKNFQLLRYNIHMQ